MEGRKGVREKSEKRDYSAYEIIGRPRVAGMQIFRHRPPGLAQPDAPCERTDIRAGMGLLQR
jgi:hypothetical protein